MVKTLDKYFISLFFKKLLMLSIIFFSLSFTLTIFEEITFLSDTTSAFYLPFMLAIFNAPIDLDNHEYKALHCALEIQNNIKVLNEELKAEGIKPNQSRTNQIISDQSKPTETQTLHSKSLS